MCVKYGESVTKCHDQGPLSGTLSIGSLANNLGGFALGHYGLLELHPESLREFIDSVIAINLNGLLGCVQDHMAVVAPMKMFIEFGAYGLTHCAIQVIGQLIQKFFAVLHGWPSPPFLNLKYFARRSRSCKRARSNRDLTAGMLNPNISAVSSVERPSTSRSTNTVRNPGGNP